MRVRFEWDRYGFRAEEIEVEAGNPFYAVAMAHAESALSNDPDAVLQSVHVTRGAFQIPYHYTMTWDDPQPGNTE